jgi:hypothetical protein
MSLRSSGLRLLRRRFVQCPRIRSGRDVIVMSRPNGSLVVHKAVILKMIPLPELIESRICGSLVLSTGRRM